MVIQSSELYAFLQAKRIVHLALFPHIKIHVQEPSSLLNVIEWQRVIAKRICKHYFNSFIYVKVRAFVDLLSSILHKSTFSWFRTTLTGLDTSTFPLVACQVMQVYSVWICSSQETFKELDTFSGHRRRVGQILEAK